MTKDQWKDVGERVGWTFTEAALAAVPATVVLTDFTAVKTAAVSAAVAGGAAVLALLKGMVRERRIR